MNLSAAMLMAGCGVTSNIDLWDATVDGDIQIVKQYLDAGGDVNVKDDEFYSISLLHSAVRHNHEEMVSLLLENGADINIKSTNSNTALLLTGTHGNQVIAKLLVEAGANVNEAGFGGWTTLHMASYEGHMNLVNYLVTVAGADLHIKDEGGTTALHCAAIKGHINVIKLLYLKDADINAIGDEGTTPLDAAIEGGQEEAQVLIRMLGGKTYEQVKEPNEFLRG